MNIHKGENKMNKIIITLFIGVAVFTVPVASQAMDTNIRVWQSGNAGLQSQCPKGIPVIKGRTCECVDGKGNRIGSCKESPIPIIKGGKGGGIRLNPRTAAH